MNYLYQHAPCQQRRVEPESLEQTEAGMGSRPRADPVQTGAELLEFRGVEVRSSGAVRGLSRKNARVNQAPEHPANITVHRCAEGVPTQIVDQTVQGQEPLGVAVAAGPEQIHCIEARPRPCRPGPRRSPPSDCSRESGPRR